MGSPPSLHLLLLLLAVGQGADQCGEGEVRDLDGSCVKKFVIPKKKSQCEIPIIENGNAFMASGRIIDFFCDTDYVKVPDIKKAICQVTGSWSKQVPVCLLPGCQAPPSPPSGSVSLSYSSAVATFTCLPGYSLAPHTGVLACIDGTKWNGTSPECRLVTTPPPPVGRRDASSPTSTSSSSPLSFPLLSSSLLHLLLLALASRI